MTYILGLDLGRSTGWCELDDKGRHQESGVVSFKPDRHESAGMVWQRWRSWVGQKVHHLKIHKCPLFPPIKLLVAFEDSSGFHASARAAEVKHSMAAILTMVCEDEMVRYMGVAPGTLKKFAVGKGNATKDAMCKAATEWLHSQGKHRTLLPGINGGDDQADAIHVARWAWEKME